MIKKEQKISESNEQKKAESVSDNIDTVLKEDIETESLDTDDMLDLKDQRIKNLEMQLEQSKIDIRDIQLRSQADIENLRRRMEQDIEKAHKFALERFFYELLPIIDSLERALESANRNKKDIEISVIIEGVDLTLKSLLSTVYKFGVEVIKDINIPFNPEIHQAMSVVETDEFKPNYIVKIVQHGYILNGRLLRPAMVTVSK